MADAGVIESKARPSSGRSRCVGGAFKSAYSERLVSAAASAERMMSASAISDADVTALTDLVHGIDHLLSTAAFASACALVADRRALPAARIAAGLSPAEQVAVAHARRGLRDGDIAAVAAARHEAIYLAVTVFGRPYRSVARVAGLSHAAVNKAVGKVEDLRDDPRYERELDDMELALMGAA